MTTPKAEVETVNPENISRALLQKRYDDIVLQYKAEIEQRDAAVREAESAQKKAKTHDMNALRIEGALIALKSVLEPEAM